MVNGAAGFEASGVPYRLNMLTSLEIKNFRGFKDLKFESLSRVNLIAGENNTGKTAVLEALSLVYCSDKQFHYLPQLFRNSQERFEDHFENFWLWLFYKKNISLVPKIIVNQDSTNISVEIFPSNNAGWQQQSALQVSFKVNDSETHKATIGKFSGGAKLTNSIDTTVFSVFHNSSIEDAEAFSYLSVNKNEKILIDLLKKIEPQLINLKYLKLEGEPLIYADVGMDALIPVTQLGQGFNRLLTLFSRCLNLKSRLVLIDELENGLHHNTQEKVWTGIAEIARKQDLQFFITTHSYECIRAAHKVFSKSDSYDLALHRLEWTKSGDIRAVTYDKETLGTSFKLGWEVR